MMAFIQNIILLVLVQFSCSQLQYVSQIFRHGARNPIYKNSFENITEPQNYGQLSATGIRQHYLLGSEMRKLYVDELQFLSPTYEQSEFQIQSTNYNRTMMSANSHLMGFYPPSTGPEMIDNLDPQYTFPPYTAAQNFTIDDRFINKETKQQYALPYGLQVFNIHTTLFQNDELLNFKCLKKQEFLDRSLAENQELVKEIQQEYKPIFQLLQQSLKLEKQPSVRETIQLFDTLTTMKYNDYALPAGINDQIMDQLEWLRSIQYVIENSKEYCFMKTSNFFQQMISEFDDKIANKSTFKWFMHSAHDDNLVQLMIVLNFTSVECLRKNQLQGTPDCLWSPQYASNILFELHKSLAFANQFYVKVRYNGKYMNLCEKSEGKCRYTEFKNRIQFNLNSKNEEVCGFPMKPFPQYYFIDDYKSFYESNSINGGVSDLQDPEISQKLLIEQQQKEKQKIDSLTYENQILEYIAIFQIIAISIGVIAIYVLQKRSSIN